MNTEEKLYFAYGSNMNLNQMAFRCPDAEVVDTVRLEGYRLAFCMNGGGNGVATILPEEGSYVDGVLWRISERDERHLDHYEGFPYLYGKEPVVVTDQDGIRHEIMAYTMNSPYRDVPALPNRTYPVSFTVAAKTGSKPPLFWKRFVSPSRNCRRKQFLRKNTTAGNTAKNDNLNTGPRGMERKFSTLRGPFCILRIRRIA